jgi:hypothetical protein
LFRKALDLYERDKLAYARNAMNAPTARVLPNRCCAARSVSRSEPTIRARAWVS